MSNSKAATNELGIINYLDQLCGGDVLCLVVVGVLEDHFLHHTFILVLIHHLAAAAQQFVEHVTFDEHFAFSSLHHRHI